MTNYPWQGKQQKIDDYDLPRIGRKINVGEDVIHAILDVESRGRGFDNNGVIKLFEKHVFYRNLKPSLREKAVASGLATKKWQRDYKNNHSTFVKAYVFDKEAALKGCSWGLGQILGENHKLAGYDTVTQMVRNFAADEANQLEAMISFIIATGLDDELRDLENATTEAAKLKAASDFARGYNGPQYAKNNYHTRIVKQFNWWKKRPDTPWQPSMAKEEEEWNEYREATKPARQPSPPGKSIISFIFELIRKIFAR